MKPGCPEGVDQLSRNGSGCQDTVSRLDLSACARLSYCRWPSLCVVVVLVLWFFPATCKTHPREMATTVYPLTDSPSHEARWSRRLRVRLALTGYFLLKNQNRLAPGATRHPPAETWPGTATRRPRRCSCIQGAHRGPSAPIEIDRPSPSSSPSPSPSPSRPNPPSGLRPQ